MDAEAPQVGAERDCPSAFAGFFKHPALEPAPHLAQYPTGSQSGSSTPHDGAVLWCRTCFPWRVRRRPLTFGAVMPRLYRPAGVLGPQPAPMSRCVPGV
eukprot:scaffold132376_cov11-Tisochrysis_lutea.AAC.2